MVKCLPTVKYGIKQLSRLSDAAAVLWNDLCDDDLAGSDSVAQFN